MIRVEFLYIKNTDAANDIYVCFDAAPLRILADAVKISPNESFYGRFQIQQLKTFMQLVTMDQVLRQQHALLVL